MSVLIKGLEMPETGYMDVRIFRDGTATIATGTKPYYRELKAEPVKHGKWIEYPTADGMNQCSVCGVLRFGESNYCPNCGARMDEND
jgi:rubrerythrin